MNGESGLRSSWINLSVDYFKILKFLYIFFLVIEIFLSFETL